MADWSSGYVSDIVYTYGYYPELNPLRAKLAILNKGIATLPVEAACELGFGQGLSTNIHAAASPTQWWGTDFNPAQAGFAQEMARRSGSGAQLFDQSFQEFAHRTDLPDFDFIGLHGIWSWVSNENRSVIIDFVRRKLKVGGVLYVSYNTLPGWGTLAPLRHLMTEHAAQMAGPGVPLASRIENALTFTRRLLDSNPVMARVAPQITERFNKLQQQNRHYLAHEYFNRDWHPMYFADSHRYFSDAKLQFAASAHMLDHFDPLNFSAEQSRLMSEVQDPHFRESVRDFIVNQQFRRDYWVKGVRPLTATDRTRALRNTRVMLTCAGNGLPQKVQGVVGTATVNAKVHELLVEQLDGHRTRHIAELQEAGIAKGLKAENLLEALMIASASGHVSPAQDDETVARVLPTVARLNAALVESSAGASDVAFLASARTGGAIALGRFQQRFLRHVTDGVTDADGLARLVWDTLSSQGQRLARDGKPIDEAVENIAELERQAHTFLAETLPMCRALDVAVV